MKDYKMPKELQISFQTQGSIGELINKNSEKWSVKRLLKFIKAMNKLDRSNFILLYSIYPELRDKEFEIKKIKGKRVIVFKKEEEK